MACVIRLREIADELDIVPEGWTAYLNRETGELHSLEDEVADAFDDDEEEMPAERLPDWQQKQIAKDREVLEGEEWIRLPGKFEIHEWSIMRDFAGSTPDERLRDELLRAIHGSGAFRHFKDVVYRHGIRDKWFEFKTKALENLLARFLDEHGIPYSR